MGRLLFAGGTVVTVDGSYRADVLVEDERASAVGIGLDADGAEERAIALWTLGVNEGRVSENQFVALLSTNQARIHGMYPRKGALVPGADADMVLWDPESEITATVENRHGNVDYTPHEGMTFGGGPATVYVRGNLGYKDGEVVAERGSGRLSSGRLFLLA